MIFVRRLSEPERKELKRLARKEVGRISERIRMILLSDRHYSVSEIARIFECDEATVREWIERFEAGGLEGLKDRPRSGRPCKADTAARGVIRQQLERAPSAYGYCFGFWTVVTLCAHLAQHFSITLSQATMRRVLLALDLRWCRPRHCLPQDQEAAAKMWELARRLFGMGKETAILCSDECDIHLLPLLRAMWMPKGKQVRIPTPGANRKRSIFGALELGTGRWTYSIFERKRSTEFIAFLEQLVKAYAGMKVVLILDNASIHKSKLTTEWIEGHPQLELLYLPAYSGHKENPVEKIWWRLKDQVAANRLHADLESLVATVHHFFASLTPAAALKLAA